MESAIAKNPAELRSVDPVWDRIREAAHAAAASEPVLAGTLHATILSQPRFENALSYHLARLVGTTEVPAALIRQTFDEALAADPGIGLAAIQVGVPKRVIVMDLAKSEEPPQPRYFRTEPGIGYRFTRGEPS